MRVVFTVLASLLTSLGGQTPDIHFVPAPGGAIDAMLTMAHVTADDIVYDLGSGEGDILIKAAQKHGARGVGVEIDPALIKTATERARKRGVGDKIRFIQGDLFKADISEATVVTLFLSGSINRRLEPKLKSELRPGTRVVSYRFDMFDWKPDEERKAAGRKVFLWTIK